MRKADLVDFYKSRIHEVDVYKENVEFIKEMSSLERAMSYA